MVTFRAALVHFVYQFRPATRRNHKRRKGRIERKKNANWTEEKGELNGRKTRIERKENANWTEGKRRTSVSGSASVRFIHYERSFPSQRRLVAKLWM